MHAFLERLASREPVPGGGGAAAMAAAMSAALVGMVCRVTAQRSAGTQMVVEAQPDADALRARLMALVQEDATAFEAVLEARRAGGEAPASQVRDALRRATEVPLEIARGSLRLLELCASIAPDARLSTAADLAVASALAGAALDGSALIARVNLADLDDPAFAGPVRDTLERMTDEAAELRHRFALTFARRTALPR